MWRRGWRFGFNLIAMGCDIVEGCWRRLFTDVETGIEQYLRLCDAWV